ncbi:phage/conjugal plasmid C-4 type zinc finger protein, TraR family [Pseudomonas putida]|nr:phage/conjugal plasmid C-4 type zinc finger protein, TraR family [Pseudomonas putida]
MSRIAMSCIERAKREVLPLELALYHAVRDYTGGAAAIAATTGRNATTLQHKLSPTHPTHIVNVQEFSEILELTKDPRILDSIHALVGDTIWQELSDAYTHDIPETLTMGLAEFFRQVANLAETWARSIGDGKVDDQELAEIQNQVFRGIQGLLGMYRRAEYVNQTTRGIVVADIADLANDRAQWHLDLVLSARLPAPECESLEDCVGCGGSIPEPRRLAVQGCQRCIECQGFFEKKGARYAG